MTGWLALPELFPVGSFLGTPVIHLYDVNNADNSAHPVDVVMNSGHHCHHLLLDESAVSKLRKKDIEFLSETYILLVLGSTEIEIPDKCYSVALIDTPVANVQFVDEIVVTLFVPEVMNSLKAEQPDYLRYILRNNDNAKAVTSFIQSEEGEGWRVTCDAFHYLHLTEMERMYHG